VELIETNVNVEEESKEFQIALERDEIIKL
jgi:hypothetical protein